MFENYVKLFIDEFVEFANAEQVSFKVDGIKEGYSKTIIKCVLINPGKKNIKEFIKVLSSFANNKGVPSDKVNAFGIIGQGFIDVIPFNCISNKGNIWDSIYEKFRIQVENGDWAAIGMPKEVSTIYSIRNKM